jgi:hypothetical protein
LAGGQPFDGGGGVGVDAFWITAVGTDVAVVVPSLFVARTRKRTVLPTSADSACSSECGPADLGAAPAVVVAAEPGVGVAVGVVVPVAAVAVELLALLRRPEIVGGEVFSGFAVPAARLKPANAESEATTTAATPAPKAAPMAIQRFLCVVCISYPFRLLVVVCSWCPLRHSPDDNGSKRRFPDAYTVPHGLTSQMPLNLAERTLELVNIPSPSREEAPLLEYVRPRCRCRSPTGRTRRCSTRSTAGGR